MRLAALLAPRGRAREAQFAHALRTVPLFRDLPAGDLVAIWRQLREVRIPARDMVSAIAAARGEAILSPT